MSFRDDKASSILLHIAATYIAREAGRGTLITPTRAFISSDRKNAIVYVSVFPDDQKDFAVAFLNRHRDDFRNYLKSESRFSSLPRVTFEFDAGEQNRQHLDDISRDI
ncbi:ribosome-binding factor A [Patescibacteria group bacterium]|nr:ribosome-binding factor A [Patescibacteria group bacterium]